MIIALFAFSVNVLSIEAGRDLLKQNNFENTITLNKSDGDKAPDFALKSVDGKTIKLSDYKGKGSNNRFLGDLVSALQKRYS